MKSLLLVLFSLSLSWVLIESSARPSPVGDGAVRPALASVLPAQVYVPPGFDDNDNTQVTVTGQYMNSCYRTGPNEVRVDKTKKQIFISSQAYFYSSSWCLQVLVPYFKTIEIGILPAGTYDLLFANGDGKFKALSRMPVAVAHSATPDENVYAVITGAHVEKNILWLTGSLSSNCTHIKKILVKHRVPGVIEVLPIAEIDTNVVCQALVLPLETQVELPADAMGRGQTLIHIRSLNGQAINRVVNL